MTSSYCDSNAEPINIFVSFIPTRGCCNKLERYQIFALDYKPNQYEHRENSRLHGVKSFEKRSKKIENLAQESRRGQMHIPRSHTPSFPHK